MSKLLRQRTFSGFQADSDPLPVGEPADITPSDQQSQEGPQVVYVVDCFSLIFQVFHALPEMSSPDGQAVGAVYGFLRDILDLLEKQQPDYLFAAFDSPGDTFRHEVYSEYKATRDEIPTDLRPQIGLCRRALETWSVPVFELPRFEADDILATVARVTRERGWQCVLVTADKDCRQLLSDQVQIFNVRKGEFYGATELQRDWGISPKQVVDFQALVGDSSDNVPGVSLIGPKIASQLLGKYGTLEGVLDHADDVSGAKRRENLQTGREVAHLSRELVRLVDNLPLEIDWSAGRVSEFTPQRVVPLCREFGFRQLSERLAGLGESAAPAWRADYRTVTTLEELQTLVDQLGEQPCFSLDTETTSTHPRWAEIVGYSFAWVPGNAYYVPVRAPQGDPCLDPVRVADILRPVLESSTVQKIGQNLKYERIVLRSAGLDLRGVAFDTMVADYLIDPGERNHSLDDLARRYLGHAKIKIRDLIGTGKKQKQMDQVPVNQVAPYAAEDADVPLRLRPMLEERLQQQELDSLFADLEMPLIEVLAEMEYNGIRVDEQRLEQLGQRFSEKMAGLQEEIHHLAGGEFNIDSPQQLARILFEKLELPVIKRTKTGTSTDVQVLTELAPLHPLPAKMVAYRQFAKLKSTYADSLRQLINPQTGRVHTSFKQDVAATGRLSSQEPNLQNIPVRSDEGRAIRSAFIPGESGWKLITADYSQIELRVLAHFCGDPTLVRAFAEDQDIHATVAAQIHRVPLEQVDSAMRRKAKAVNFGVIYGQSAFGLARALEIDKGEAAEFIEAYFARYPEVDEFMRRTLVKCRQKGYVSTILGRRRAVQGVRDPSSLNDPRQRNLPERIAINTVIQGSAADLIKKAMLSVHRSLQAEPLAARLLLQIHDELIFEVREDQIARLAERVVRAMESVESLAVPLKVDVKVGENWAQCEAWS